MRRTCGCSTTAHPCPLTCPALVPLPHPPQGEKWKQTTVRTALAFPGFVSVIFLSLNFMVWGQRSSGAVPFGTLCALVFLWCGISVPLCFVGSYFGYKKPAPEVRWLAEEECMRLRGGDGGAACLPCLLPRWRPRRLLTALPICPTPTPPTGPCAHQQDPAPGA